MERTELLEINDLMRNDLAAIIHNQLILANLHEELDRSLLNPVEEDFIYREQFDQFPAEPTTIIINGISISKRRLHRSGIQLRDIRGADLLYEIEDEKFIIIQYKKASGQVVKNDPIQLNVLLSNCPEVCPNKKKRPIPKDWVPLKIFSFCGCWYNVIDGTNERHMPACEAEAIFQGRKTKIAREFQSGMSKESFLELFAACRIGALINYPQDVEVRDAYVSQLIEDQHIIFEFEQRGRWS